VLLFCTSLSFAQKSAEFGGQLGLSSYLGDLQEKTLKFGTPSFNLGLQAKYNFNSRFAARLNFVYGQIQGDDSRSDIAWRQTRNLNFKSSIAEVALMGEFNLFNFGYHSQNLKERNYIDFAPYFSTGIAIFRFNPQAEYLGQWMDLQPLGTEGQGSSLNPNPKYSLTQIAIPVNIGLKFHLKDNLVCAFEIGWRKTFTDYLDDVSGNYVDFDQLKIENGEASADLSFRGDELASYDGVPPKAGTQRGTPSNDDGYIMANLNITYKIFRNNDGGKWYKLNQNKK